LLVLRSDFLSFCVDIRATPYKTGRAGIAMSNPRVMIVGFDAATWDVAKPWIAQGHMPNLARLMREGAHGKFQSVEPPITPPAWTSLTTGKNPGKHGVFHFMETRPDSYRLSYTNASSRRTLTVWKILNDAGLTTGTTNIPFTYPPEPLNGYQISGMDTPSPKSPFVYPSELRQELEDMLGHRLRLDVGCLGSMTNDERRGRVLAEMRELDEQWTRVALHLLQHHSQDVMMFVFMSTDTVQHYFWQFMDENHFLHDAAAKAKLGHAIRDVYNRLDQTLGKLLAYAGPETTVFVVSDHGAGAVSDRTICLNRFLAQNGLLYYRPSNNKPAQKATRAVIRNGYNLLLSNLSAGQKVWLADHLPALRAKVEASYTSFNEIDWSRTRAFCTEVLLAPASIWINLKGVRPQGIVEPGDYEKVRDEVAAKLALLKDPRTGAPVIKRVLKREEVFHGPFANEAADLILDWWQESYFSTSPSFWEETNEPAKSITEKRPTRGSEWGGTHRLHGILAASGPQIKRGSEIEGARLIDFAPTLLYVLGQPIPRDMDGQVLERLFDLDFLRDHPVRYDGETEQPVVPAERVSSYSPEEAAQVEERLKALGYVE
jgi:predicted AlkP superfamily phosphohydrolase/phosphomutase